MPNWTFLTHHGHVLVAVVQNPDLTIDQIAQRVGITSRATASILGDLVQAGYLVKERIGRNNRYTVHADSPMRHPLNEKASVAELLNLFK